MNSRYAMSFPGGAIEVKRPSRAQLLESAATWLQLASDSLKRGAAEEFDRCMVFFDRAMTEAREMAK